MTSIEVFLIALSMSLDAFAVCLGAGTRPQTCGRRPAFRLSFHFGLFQAMMPVIGWFLGATIAPLTITYGPWIALGLLAFIGFRMIRSGLDEDCDCEERDDPSRGLTLVLLSIATSIDALAIGLSLAFLNVDVWYPALVIGLVTGTLSLVGLRIGNGLGGKFGKPVEIAGGVVLILIGVRVVLSHLIV